MLICLFLALFSSSSSHICPPCNAFRFHHNETFAQDLQHQEEGRAGENEQIPRGCARALYDEARQDRGQRPRSQATLLQGVNIVGWDNPRVPGLDKSRLGVELLIMCNAMWHV